MDLTDDIEGVLRVIAHGRANLHHVCQQSGLGESRAEQALATLVAEGLATKVDRGLYAVTSDGLDALDRDYPAEAGFLQATDVIHDAPTIKTVRLRGDRGLVEVQVDASSTPLLADALCDVLADTHGDHDAVAALRALARDKSE